MTKKDLFDQWNTKTLGGSTKLSVDNFDLIQDPVHVEAANEPSLELVNLVGQATNTQSHSGPLGQTLIVETELTYTEVGAATGYKLHHRPAPGEIWQLIAVSALMSGGSSGMNLIIGPGVTNITTIESPYVLLAQESSSGQPIFDTLDGAVHFYDNTNAIIHGAYSLATGEEQKMFTLSVRVR